MATTPMGMLMKNAQRQLAAVVSQPPRSGPRAAAAPAIAPHTPKATPRIRPVNVPEMMESVDGDVMAAPSPCSARAPISMPMEEAAPESTEPAMNTATPITNISLRPSWSPILPKVTMSAA